MMWTAQKPSNSQRNFWCLLVAQTSCIQSKILWSIRFWGLFCSSSSKTTKVAINNHKLLFVINLLPTNTLVGSTNEMLGIVWNGFCQSLAAVRVVFENKTVVQIFTYGAKLTKQTERLKPWRVVTLLIEWIEPIQMATTMQRTRDSVVYLVTRIW